MSSKKNDEIIDEDQIVKDLGTLYDQQKKSEGYKDELTYTSQPYRYITNWKYIPNKKTRSSKQTCSALPSDNTFSSTDVILGLLEGVVKEEDDGPTNSCLPKIQVRLTNLKTWCIDRSDSTRGIWVETSLAWYKLKQPSKESMNGISQEEVHIPLRAKFGLVSNIVDLLSEKYADVKSNYVAIHAKRTPTAIYKLLSPTAALLEEYSKPPDILYHHPFDLNLLKQCPGFIKQHLTNFHPLLTHDCVFMQSLLQMEKDSAKAKECTQEEYLKSALDAEKRGNRTPWGDWLGGPIVKVSPNRLIDIEIRAAQRAAALAATESHNSADEEKNKPKVVERRNSKEKSTPDIPVPSTNLNIIQTPKLKFCAEAMSEAKRELKPYLIESTAPYPAIAEEHFTQLKKNIILSPNILNLELILHVIESLRVSSKKVLKSVFSKKVENSVAGTVIFTTWLDYCILIITNSIRSGLFKMEDVGTEEMIIESIMKLICDFSVISSEKQLSVMKDKFNVDWVSIVDKTLRFSNENKIRNLITPCIDARNHLLDMKRGKVTPSKQEITTVKSETKISPPTAIKKPVISKADVVTIDDEEEKKSASKRKKMEEELRRKRMMELMKQAKGSSHRAASVETNHDLNEQYNGKHSPMQPLEQQGDYNRFGGYGRGENASNGGGGRGGWNGNNWNKSNEAKFSPTNSPYHDEYQKKEEIRFPESKANSFAPPNERVISGGWTENSSGNTWGGNANSGGWSSSTPTPAPVSTISKDKNIDRRGNAYNQEINSRQSSSIPGKGVERQSSYGSKQGWTSSNKSSIPSAVPITPSVPERDLYRQTSAPERDSYRQNISSSKGGANNTTEQSQDQVSWKSDNNGKSDSFMKPLEDVAMKDVTRNAPSRWGGGSTKPASSGWGGSSSSSGGWGAKATAHDTNRKDSPNNGKSLSRKESNDSWKDRPTSTQIEPAKDSSVRSSERTSHDESNHSSSWNSCKATSFEKKDSFERGSSWSNDRESQYKNAVAKEDTFEKKDFVSGNFNGKSTSHDKKDSLERGSSWRNDRESQYKNADVTENTTFEKKDFVSGNFNVKSTSHEKKDSLERGSSWSNNNRESQYSNTDAKESTAMNRETANKWSTESNKSHSSHEEQPKSSDWSAPKAEKKTSWGVSAPQSSSSSWGQSKTNDVKSKDSWKPSTTPIVANHKSATDLEALPPSSSLSEPGSWRTTSKVENVSKLNVDESTKMSNGNSNWADKQTSSWKKLSATSASVIENKEQQTISNHSTDYKKESSKQASTSGWGSSNPTNTWTKSSSSSSSWSVKKSSSSAWASSTSSHVTKSKFEPRQKVLPVEEDEDGEIVDNSDLESNSQQQKNSSCDARSSREDDRRQIPEKESDNRVRNAVDDKQIVAALGRGRGRGRTLPAWMTNNDSAPKEEPAPQESQRLSPITAGGNGEFKESGWISNKRARGPKRFPDRKESDNKHMKLEHNDMRGRGGSGRKESSPVRNEVNEMPEIVAPAGRGRGRGRTLPAWMTSGK